MVAAVYLCVRVYVYARTYMRGRGRGRACSMCDNVTHWSFSSRGRSILAPAKARCSCWYPGLILVRCCWTWWCALVQVANCAGQDWHVGGTCPAAYIQR